MLADWLIRAPQAASVSPAPEVTSCSGDVVDPGEAATSADVPASGFLLDLSGDDDDGRQFTGDLYDLVWGSGRGGGGGGGGIAALSSPASEVLPAAPPSEHEMEAWLRTIVTGGGQEQYYDAAAGVRVAAGERAAVPAEETERQSTAETKLPATEINFNGAGQDTTRKTVRGARRANYAESHRQTEKRRRWKINERLKTLQQLVPGCSETNQVSTLEQTIRYVKSLQQQLRAMAPAAATSAGGYGVVRPVVVCAGDGVPLMLPVSAIAGPRRGCVVPGQGLCVGPQGWQSVWAFMGRRPPSACTDDAHGPS